VAEVLTLKEVAEHFNKRPNTISDWRKAGCPALQSKIGPYDLDAVGEWVLFRRRADKRAERHKPSPLASRFQVAKTKLAECRAELLAYRVAVASGRLLCPKDAAEVIDHQAREFRRELEEMPSRYAHRLVGCRTVEEAEARLREIVWDILQRLSRLD